LECVIYFETFIKQPQSKGLIVTGS